MPLPQVAIVGRPNVGKSSLLNRLARQRISIVDPTPGVTRDRVAAIVEIDPPLEMRKGTPSRLIELIDTGGYGVYTAEGQRYNEIGADLATLTPDIEAQIGLARATAALILFVVDSQAGITALDETIARILRQEGASPRVLVVANKTDGEEWEPHGLEASALGFGTPVCVSATSKFGMRRLIDAIYERLSVHAGTESPPHAGPDAAPHAGPDALGRPGFPSGTGTDTDMKLAIVGKRNSGKSTLVNTLAGEERVIVSEIAGTTRDSIDVRFEIEGRAMLAIDTAGLRKRSSFADDIEYYAYHRMLQAIRRADVAILLVDAAEPVSQVDQKLAQELTRQFKPVVIVVNKIDLLDKDKVSPEDYQEYLTEQLKGLNYAPIVFVSAKSGEGLRDMVAMAFNLFQQASHREPTGRINQVVEMILKERGPSSRLGKQAKLFYVTQVETNPPTLVLVVNEPKLFRGRYERYLLNRLREELPFSEVPIRVLFKKRERMSVQEMKERARETTDQHGSTQIRG